MKVTYEIYMLIQDIWVIPESPIYRTPTKHFLELTANRIKSGEAKDLKIKAYIDGKYSNALSIKPKR